MILNAAPMRRYLFCGVQVLPAEQLVQPQLLGSASLAKFW